MCYQGIQGAPFFFSSLCPPPPPSLFLSLKQLIYASAKSQVYHIQQ